MKISQAGINLIKNFEAFRERAYLDGGGVPTIGWGFTKGVKLGQTMTRQEADARFLVEILPFERCIAAKVKAPLSQNQYDALVSLIYNIGETNFSKSTLLTRLNERDYGAAGDQFLRWKYDNGKFVQGLLNRRIKERILFMGGKI